MGVIIYDTNNIISSLSCRQVFNQEESEAKTSLLIVQCDSGHLNYDLIACARYRVCNEATKAKAKDQLCGATDVTHILFIVRLPQQEVKSQFVGFQGEPWISVHIDELRIWSKATILPQQAFTAKISEMFIGKYDEKKPERQLYKDPEAVSTTSVESEEDTNVPKEPEEMKQSTEDFIASKEPEEMEIITEKVKMEEALDLEKAAVGLEEPKIIQSDRGDFVEITFEPKEPEQKRVMPKVLNYVAMELSTETELEKESEVPEEIEATSNNPLDEANKQISSESEKPLEDFSDSEDSSSSSDDTDQSFLSRVANSTVVLKESNISIENSVSQLQETSLLSNEVQHISVRSMNQNRKDEHFKWNMEVEGFKQLHANHQRLLGCVQAAVSMLENSTGDRSMKRIQKLVELIQLDEPDKLVCQGTFKTLHLFM